MKNQSLSDQNIINYLNTYYDIKVKNFIFLPWGADTNASVYKAQRYDNSTYFVKIKHGDFYDIGVVVQQLLHDAGIQEIIAPLKTNSNQLMQHINDVSLIVYPFIEGDNGFVKNLTRDQWIALGKTLRKIHECKVPISLTTQIRQETWSSQWRNVVKSLDEFIEDTKTYDEIALKFLDFYKKHGATIKRLVDCAEQLAIGLKNLSHEFVLCHSDIHAGNVLITKKGAFYIIDWDSPIMAPKERDLMFIGGGVANVWNNPQEEQSFYLGYGKTEISRDIITYYRCERIIEDIAIYSEQLLSSQNQNQEYEPRFTAYNHFISMFEPNGVVDIAFFQ